MERSINGIQQVGIGVSNACEAFEWYKKYLGFSAIVFEDRAPAALMTRYTGNCVHERYAVLVMNMQGGGGFELWQYTSRVPKPSLHLPQLGDTGIFAVKLRCNKLNEAYQELRSFAITAIAKNTHGLLHFYIKDPYGNYFDIVENEYWFTTNGTPTGGVCGAVIGVTDMKAAIHFYRHVLGYDHIHSDQESVFTDFHGLPGAEKGLHRVILGHRKPYTGAFSRLLGPSTIELIQATEGVSRKIFDNRYWGDLGFIHICYDICGMQQHEALCAHTSQPLTVNSANSFAMGKAAGHFAYNEDPDGTLIEYVETHKVPILKKLGWYLDLQKRKANTPLPDWIVRCIGLGKKKLQLSN